MRTRFDQQLEKLHVELIKMGSLCEQAITLAASSLEVQEENTLHKVAALESEVAEPCIRITVCMGKEPQDT